MVSFLEKGASAIYNFAVVDEWLEGEQYHLEGDLMRPTFAGVVLCVDFEIGC